MLEKYPEIKLCGVENILDRGLKYMSTGEIRRTLLARALISKKKLLYTKEVNIPSNISYNIQKNKNTLDYIQRKKLSFDFNSIGQIFKEYLSSYEYYI